MSPWQLRLARKAAEDLDSRPSVGDLAKLCKMSPSYFSRRFKLATGKSPGIWLLEQRLSKAIDMMTASDASLAEISVICGFSDQSHFTRTFTRAKGQPPAAWRRLNRRA